MADWEDESVVTFIIELIAGLFVLAIDISIWFIVGAITLLVGVVCWFIGEENDW